MLRRFLDYQLSLTEPGKPLHFIRPLVTAGDTFLYEAPINTTKGPHIRDAVDIKRWMIIVVFALIPAILAGLWNTGMQSFVYSSGDYRLMNEFIAASGSWDSYWEFAAKDMRFLTILKLGVIALLPIVIISYTFGGLWEALFACVRGHEISEGFLVTGILYALILPSTIPYWMAAVGVSAGVVIAKEVFGGSGMNIMNPALSCRAFLFFTFPGRMTGEIWAGTNPTVVRESIVKMNQEAHTGPLDGYTQATPLAQFNVPHDIKRVHIDAIASNNLGSDVSTYPAIESHFKLFTEKSHVDGSLGALSQEQMRAFVTSPASDGGLGLSPGYYEDAYRFSSLNYGLGDNHDLGFFLGNKLGCMGETSTIAILIGAIILIWTGVGSWRTMAGMALGAYFTALLLQLCSTYLGIDGGAWLPAQLGFPAYKHLLLGGLAFGLVFMATDPVSSPSMNSAKWVYGIFCGVVTIIIRTINPAYPEGVMLAILMGNVFAPLLTITLQDSIASGGHNVPSEPLETETPVKRSENAKTLIFMVVLSLACAVILSLLASALQKPKEEAKELDRSKQMMIAAKIMNYNGTFLLQNDKGEYVPAKVQTGGALVPGSLTDVATKAEILAVVKKRLLPILVDDKGNEKTFKEAGLNEDEYTATYKKSGYYNQPLKLVYKIMPNVVSGAKENDKPVGYVFPINGFGLWDAIYGYLAVKPDGNTIIGISWYDQKETPGLGANISEESWQSLFPGKQIFQPGTSESLDLKTSPLGVVVVKGKVSEVLGDSPKSKTAVDGMAGATLTGNGVTDAYRNVLSAYRPFLIKIHEMAEKDSAH